MVWDHEMTPYARSSRITPAPDDALVLLPDPKPPEPNTVPLQCRTHASSGRGNNPVETVFPSSTRSDRAEHGRTLTLEALPLGTHSA